MRKIVLIDEEKCDGCGLCVPSCHEGAIQIQDGKARLVAEPLCDGLGDCLSECPRGAITLIEREAEAYDEAAVQKHLATRKATSPSDCPGEAARTLPGPGAEVAPGGGCPGEAARTLPVSGAEVSPGGGCPGQAARTLPGPGVHAAPGTRTHSEARPAGQASALGHWPIKLELLNPAAPFLRGADLLLTADCAPAAVPSFNERFLGGKVLALACPKFGNHALFLERLTAILRESSLQSLTVVHMEVPCCSGLIALARQALADSGAECRLETVRVGLEGSADAPAAAPAAAPPTAPPAAP